MFRALRRQGKQLRRNWLPVLLILCVFGGIVWLLLPEKPYDLADEETKTFQSKQADFSMTIPFNWDPITEETVKQVVVEAGQKEMSEQGRNGSNSSKPCSKWGRIIFSPAQMVVLSTASQSSPCRFPDRSLWPCPMMICESG